MAHDRRKTFRSPLPLEEQAATLTFAREDYSVRVLNLSAGGFEIMISRKPPFKVGDTVHLLVSEKTNEARVTRIMKTGAGAKVGLKRINELSKNVAGQRSTVEQFLGPFLRMRTSMKAALIMGTSAAVVCLAVVVGKGWNDSRQHADALSSLHRWRAGMSQVNLNSDLKRTLRGREGLDVLAVPEIVEVLELTPKQQLRIGQYTTEAATLTATEKETGMLVERLSTLQREALAELTELQKARLEMIMRQAASPTYFLRDLARKHWPKADARELYEHLGAAALTLPKVADELSMSDEQRTKINAIVEAALDTSEELYEQGRFLAGTSQLAGKTEAVLEQAREDVLAMLTDEQRQQLAPKKP